PIVVSAAGGIETARLVGDDLEPEEPGYTTPGPAHVSLYLGFRADVENLGGTRYCQWFYETWDSEVDVWDVSPGRDPGRAAVLFCSFPSIKDPAHDPGPELRHTGEAITFVPWEPFARWQGTRWGRRPDGYEAFKEELTDALLGQYLEHYPRLAPHVDHVELSTPLSTQHFARSAQGSIYGLATEPRRFFDPGLLPRSRVKGLYVGGVDASTPGIAGGLSGGVMAAVAVEPLRGTRFVRSLMRAGAG
ncbi:MAG TPA: NAD(P)/FAD-dependent oxidoreductase, partial [Acidimicrobiia bacterium]|nr:NAD(P)/FAD-dependent oxidoreductase [Acidimicrobiia bacterium]